MMFSGVKAASRYVMLPLTLDRQVKRWNQASVRSTRQVVHSCRVTFLFLLWSHDLQTQASWLREVRSIPSSQSEGYCLHLW